MIKNWIFSYGTLSNPEYIQLLLKRLPVFTDGILSDYELLIHPQNHYLFIRPSIGKSVTGKILEVSNDELQLIDLWEDVPLYKREIKEIITGDSRIKAFVYTQNETTGLPLEAIYQKDHESILADINMFLSSFSSKY